METNKNEFEKLVQKAFDSRSDDSDTEDCKCLSDQTVQKLYEGKLKGSEHLKALEHLDKCSQCSDDLALYAQLTGDQENPAAMTNALSKLQKLKELLPVLSGFLSKWDLNSVYEVVNNTLANIKDGLSYDTVNNKLEQIMLTLRGRYPKLMVQTRGQDQNPSLSREADLEEMFSQIKEQLKTVATDEYWLSDLSVKAASAEAELFNRLGSSLALEAAQIRDLCRLYYQKLYCENRAKGPVNFGSAHAMKMLAVYADLINKTGLSVIDNLMDFVIYCSAYCYDMVEVSSQEFINTGLFDQDSRLWHDTALESNKMSGLIRDICSFDINTSKLSDSEPVFFKGNTFYLPVTAIAAFVKILDILSSGRFRPEQFKSISELDLPVDEYLKHELIEQVSIGPESIEITAVIKYEYPFDKKIIEKFLKKEIVHKIKTLAEEVSLIGYKIPEIKLDVNETIFKKRHSFYEQLGSIGKLI